MKTDRLFFIFLSYIFLSGPLPSMLASIYENACQDISFLPIQPLLFAASGRISLSLRLDRTSSHLDYGFCDLALLILDESDVAFDFANIEFVFGLGQQIDLRLIRHFDPELVSVPDDVNVDESGAVPARERFERFRIEARD